MPLFSNFFDESLARKAPLEGKPSRMFHFIQVVKVHLVGAGLGKAAKQGGFNRLIVNAGLPVT